MKNKLSVIIVISFLLVGLLVGAGIASAISMLNSGLFYDPNHSVEQELHIPDYPVNKNGESYGSVTLAIRPEDEPDLLAVTGDNGRDGYVRKVEFYGEMPSSPEEAIRQQNERISRGETSRVVDVYESDGVTKIDTFTIQAPNETTNN